MKNSLGITRTAIAVALLVIVPLLLFACGPAAQVVLQGGEKPLQVKQNPVQAGPRVIVFALDGAGYNQFMDAVHSGKAPNIQRLFGRDLRGGVFAHAYSVPDTLAVLPTTLPGWTATFTGTPSAYNGVTGDEFFLRRQMKFYAPVPVSVGNADDTMRMLSDDLLGKVIETPTVFEQLKLRSYVSLNGVYRGADIFTQPDRTSYAGMLAAVAKAALTGSPTDRAVFAHLDQTSVDSVISTIDQHGFPDLQVVYFPGIDLYTHRAGNPLHDESVYIEEVTDPAVGRVIDYYRQHQMLDKTYILFVADHGHTPAMPDNRHALGNDTDRSLPRLLEGKGFRVRPPALDTTNQDYQAVMAYQGVMAYIYLANRSKCAKQGMKCDWTRPPRFRQDVMPVVRALYRSNRIGRPIAQFKGTLDLIFARVPVAAGRNTHEFEIFDGRRLVPIRDYLRRHPRPDLVDLDQRMRWFSAGPYGDRDGDIVVLPKFSYTKPIQDRYYFGPPYCSEHGSPSLQDSHIPLVLASTAASGQQLRRLVRGLTARPPTQLDVVPLIKAIVKGSAEVTAESDR
ncbi:MAG: alkaline phosphatase family protein [Candidatus Binataceae bacterium]|nr:alkaline phosphatase family protein [Candidatus Binataceae bacterium]